MSSFISKADYKYQIRTERLDQILDAADEDEEALLDSAEGEAIAILRSYLDNKYDMDYELAKSGASRHKVLLRYAKILTIAYIYERVPDEMVPERVTKLHDKVMEKLELVEADEAEIPGLKLKTFTDEDGEVKNYTRRRWGSQPRRSNDGGSPRYLDR